MEKLFFFYWLKLLAISFFVLVFVLKIVVLLWWKPRRIEEHFSKQGIRGPPYRFFIGNVKELVEMMLKASSQPMQPFSHNILPRVLSFYHHWKKIYGATFLVWFGPTVRLTVSDPDLIREIFSTKSEFYEKIEAHPLVKQLEGDGLLSLKEDVITRTAFGSSYEDGKAIFRLQAQQMVLAAEAFQKLSMILNESLRLYPPTIATIRRSRTDVELGGYKIPRGTELLIPILAVHHDQSIWGNDANDFNPGRFSDGVGRAAKHSVAFIPFGLGVRTCIGQNLAILQAKLTLAIILQRFSFRLAPSYQHAPTVLCFYTHNMVHPSFLSGYPIPMTHQPEEQKLPTKPI
ncbi:hypothetical protein GH714_016338 [Hevea brasiliensis]|uniref:Cytochrome P450 n=1 Tax=Hevea brasiliensis TaxID=3981 RepID=A0A6A6MBP5_HEVBR|nr:hypothetical protein GH714_016338 [Hevea brasiliensis]